MIVLYSKMDLEKYTDYLNVISVGFVVCLFLSPFLLFRNLPKVEEYELQKYP